MKAVPFVALAALLLGGCQTGKGPEAARNRPSREAALVRVIDVEGRGLSAQIDRYRVGVTSPGEPGAVFSRIPPREFDLEIRRGEQAIHRQRLALAPGEKYTFAVTFEGEQPRVTLVTGDPARADEGQALVRAINLGKRPAEVAIGGERATLGSGEASEAVSVGIGGLRISAKMGERALEPLVVETEGGKAYLVILYETGSEPRLASFTTNPNMIPVAGGAAPTK